MRVNKMPQAEELRYAKIQRVIDLLCGKDKTILDDMLGDGFNKPFNVGRKITVHGKNITIKNKVYNPFELQKVTINTEGTLSIYDQSGRKLCGGIFLNVSTKNIELFSLWVRKYNVPAQVVSGKRERMFQWSIFALALLVVVLLKFLRIFDDLRYLLSGI